MSALITLDDGKHAPDHRGADRRRACAAASRSASAARRSRRSSPTRSAPISTAPTPTSASRPATGWCTEPLRARQRTRTTMTPRERVLTALRAASPTRCPGSRTTSRRRCRSRSWAGAPTSPRASSAARSAWTASATTFPPGSRRAAGQALQTSGTPRQGGLVLTRKRDDLRLRAAVDRRDGRGRRNRAAPSSRRACSPTAIR